ncbi:uncharacterized protein LOC108295021 [Cebus imitator]|uniref:uncharacterized protein LOC108295021 n=1 Tax=Cebus imitator TaxID=2715852 RepID=UPI00189B81C2|nr:uncharacterized protein LOC108295021 [Cebus imitator]
MNAEAHAKTYVLRIAELQQIVSPQDGMEAKQMGLHTPLACAGERESHGETYSTRPETVLPRPEDDVSTAGPGLTGPPANQPLPCTGPCCVPCGNGEVKPAV